VWLEVLTLGLPVHLLRLCWYCELLLDFVFFVAQRLFSAVGSRRRSSVVEVVPLEVGFVAIQAGVN